MLASRRPDCRAWSQGKDRLRQQRARVGVSPFGQELAGLIEAVDDAHRERHSSAGGCFAQGDLHVRAHEVLHDHAVVCVEQADDLASDVREHAVAVPAEILVEGRQALWRVVAHAIEAEMAVLREGSDDGGHVTGHLGTEMLEERGIEKRAAFRSEEHTSELQLPVHLVCRLLLEKKKKMTPTLMI